MQFNRVHKATHIYKKNTWATLYKYAAAEALWIILFCFFLVASSYVVVLCVWRFTRLFLRLTWEKQHSSILHATNKWSTFIRYESLWFYSRAIVFAIKIEHMVIYNIPIIATILFSSFFVWCDNVLEYTQSFIGLLHNFRPVKKKNHICISKVSVFFTSFMRGE